GLGDVHARLARRGPRRPSGTPNDRAHGVPRQRPSTGSGRHGTAAAAKAREKLVRGLRAGDLDVVVAPHDVDAVAGALFGRVDDIQAQAGRHTGALARCGEQVTGVVLHVREPVDVELEDLGCVLDTQAVAGAQILVDPDLQVFTHPIRAPVFRRCSENFFRPTPPA